MQRFQLRGTVTGLMNEEGLASEIEVYGGNRSVPQCSYIVSCTAQMLE